jgi:hypothetical protein
MAVEAKPGAWHPARPRHRSVLGALGATGVDFARTAATALATATAATATEFDTLLEFGDRQFFDKILLHG